MIIDAWAEYPTLRHASAPIFDSLRRWTGSEQPTQELPVAALAGLDALGLDDDVREAFLAGNAARVFGLDAQ
jgi:hypothetical protein